MVNQRNPGKPSDLVKTRKWGTWWTHSLRARLVVLSLAPFAIAFPLIMAVVIAVGGSSFDRALASNALGKVEGVRTYLDQIKARSLDTIKQHATGERLTRVLAWHTSSTAPRNELADALAALARENQFDFLLIADDEGKIIAASTGAEAGRAIPATFVTRQANTGVATVEYEALSAAQLASISPSLAERRASSWRTATRPAKPAACSSISPYISRCQAGIRMPFSSVASC